MKSKLKTYGIITIIIILMLLLFGLTEIESNKNLMYKNRKFENKVEQTIK